MAPIISSIYHTNMCHVSAQFIYKLEIFTVKITQFVLLFQRLFFQVQINVISYLGYILCIFMHPTLITYCDTTLNFLSHYYVNFLTNMIIFHCYARSHCQVMNWKCFVSATIIYIYQFEHWNHLLNFTFFFRV